MRRFTDEEKLRAVDLYFEKNITTKEVVDCLGYPTRQNLERWLSKDPRYGGNFRHGFYSIDTKIKAVELYKGGAFTATQIAEKLNIGSMAVVLNWVQRVEQTGYAGLIPRKRGAAMPKPKLPEIPDDKDELKRRCEQLECSC
jgi:transposase-like protein